MPSAASDRRLANFHLIVLRNQTRYRARVISSPVGEAAVDFDLPFGREEMTRFSWRGGFHPRNLLLLKAPGGSTQSQDTRAPSSLEELGARLFDALFGGEVGQLFYRSLDAGERDQCNLRIQLQMDDAPDVAELPWEYLYSRQLDRFLVLSTRTPLVRYLGLAQPQALLAAPLPLRLLVIVAGPSDLPPLAVEAEWQRLQQALAPLTQTGVLLIQRLEKATLAALRQNLRTGAVNLLHFIGHGDFGAPTQANSTAAAMGRLFFEDENGQHQAVTAAELATLLHDHDPLRLVYLNACQGAAAGAQNIFAGVAQKLVQQGIPAVLAMQFAISDRAAIALAHEFYQALTAGLPVESALSEARKAIYSEGEPYEWATPVLFSRSPDGLLVALPQEGATTMTVQPTNQPAPKPWWQQIGDLSASDPAAIDPASISGGGDVIIGVVGAGAKNVAIGKHITQLVQEIVGPPTPDDKQVIAQKLAQVSAALQQSALDDTKKMMAESYLQLLQGELVKTGKEETPSAGAITLVGNWLLDNVPALLETLTSLFVTPAAARVIAKAGETAVTWVKARFGGA